VIEALWEEARMRLDRVRAPALADEVGRGALLVDIRPAEQRRQGGDLDGAIIIDRNVIEWRLTPSSPWRIPELAGPDHRVVVACNEGFASALVALALRELGLVRATDLEGGYQALIGAHNELVDGRPAADRSVWSDSWILR
jgi:rhodanese-related sulfurtransferase